jgi:hypothetical protein
VGGKTWETTPDGRLGWNEHSVRTDRPLYPADRVSRARSHFDPSTFNAVEAGTLPPGQLPNVSDSSYRAAWSIFGFGPNKQMIPDLNAVLRWR